MFRSVLVVFMHDLMTIRTDYAVVGVKQGPGLYLGKVVRKLDGFIILVFLVQI